MQICHRLAVVAACLATGPADAECRIGRLLELPVTMIGLQPTVTIKVNGHDARFVADSGAFYSMISPGSAAELGLPLENSAPSFLVSGVGGSANVQVTTVKSIALGKTVVPNVKFLVGGSEVGAVGLLGQNVLGLADVEYDLAGGALRLMQAHGCSGANLAYWVKPGQAYSVVAIHAMDTYDRHTTGSILVNGAKVTATFDTGAALSTMSMVAARRAGIRLDGPGVVAVGQSGGIGRRFVRSWIVPVADLKIGDEEIRNTRVRVTDIGDSGFEMLIGADFFLSHRVYVSNANRKLYFSYSGGPVFNLVATEAAAAAATAAAPAGAAAPGDVAEAADADMLGRRAAARLARRDTAGAIADIDRAVALAPAEPRFLVERSEVQTVRGKPDLARADLDAALKLEPDDADARLARAQSRLSSHDQAGARSDVEAVMHAVSPASDMRLTIAQILSELEDYPAAIAETDRWIKVHPEDAKYPLALNERCWARALAGRDLDKAIADCRAAVHLLPGDADILDSLGLAQLRAGQTDRAIATYTRALAIDGKLAGSLYGRGTARLRKGDKAGQADIDAAINLDGDLPKKASRYTPVG